MMSFWVVPWSACCTTSGSSSAFCSSAATMYIESIHAATALIVIDVFIVFSGMPSISVRMSPMCDTGTPTLPTSPRESWSSGS